ncbi:MAG TPA: AmmeMemoRadiSam system protein B [Gemmatimonadales bacterium]
MRAPAVSGRFYPGSGPELAQNVRALLDAADPHAPPARLKAAVAPHAGFVYSGLTAAHVFRRATIPASVVILAPNHTGAAQAPGGASLWESGAWATPLGEVSIDEHLAALIAGACDLVAPDHAAHTSEHAVEVMLPFLQTLRPTVRIVPIVLSWDDWDRSARLGEALANVVSKSPEPVLLLASSDLNHYEPASVGEIKDAHVLQVVQTLDGKEVLARCRRERISMCGRAPVATVCAAARALGATKAELVDYRHSGWVTGDEASVVGYGGLVIP